MHASVRCRGTIARQVLQATQSGVCSRHVRMSMRSRGESRCWREYAVERGWQGSSPHRTTVSERKGEGAKATLLLGLCGGVMAVVLLMVV